MRVETSWKEHEILCHGYRENSYNNMLPLQKVARCVLALLLKQDAYLL